MKKQTANSKQNLNRLLKYLEQPEAYSHQPEKVEHVQTHISHVFIAPPYVYKLKKPVDFGFLDYSTLQKRKKCCRREVELNRRLTDDVYLGVKAITEQDGKYIIQEDMREEGTPIEYAVKMKKLPEEYFLHTYLEDNTLTTRHLNRVADKLADFYNRQQPDEDISKWGTIEKIKVNTDENFSQTEPFIGDTLDRNTFEAIRYFTNQYFDRRAELFERRIAEKRIVDGHGDLHLEHIHITPEKVQIYDCIEFNDRFRYGDLAVDLAFLAMDLDFNGRWHQERYFINRMAEKLDDPELPEIIDFYKCYRAYVKGKVKSLQSSEEEVPEADRIKAADTAARYFDLSLRYALLGSQPTLLAFMGRVGTGKSTLARHLEEKLNIERHSSDSIRKSMAGVPLDCRTPAAKRDEVYSAPMSKETYQRLFRKARSGLEQGNSVILDATFNSVSSRNQLQEIAKEMDSRLLLVEARASDEVIRQRLRDREQQQGVVSDARLEDFDKLNERYQPPEEIDADRFTGINTERAVDQTLGELYRELVDRQL